MRLERYVKDILIELHTLQQLVDTADVMRATPEMRGSWVRLLEGIRAERELSLDGYARIVAEIGRAADAARVRAVGQVVAGELLARGLEELVPFLEVAVAQAAAMRERGLPARDPLREEVLATDANGTKGPALTKVMSVADVIAAVSPISLERLERTQLGNWLVTGAINLLRQQLPQLGTALIGRDPQDGSTWLRVMLRARERQPSRQKRAIIDDVSRIVAEEFPAGPGRPAGEVTGFFVLLAQLVERMLSDQWFTFFLAAAGIFLLLAAAFSSPLLAAVALVPNALPIFVVLGVLGWAGERVNMGTAMIAAVSMGLSVDSSIHYIAAFRRRLAAGDAFTAALEIAHQTAGRAMIFSTLALVVGFLALTTSGFIPTVSFGALSCLTLTGGLVGNLVVLPVLLTLLSHRIQPRFPAAGKRLQHPDANPEEYVDENGIRESPGR